MGGTIALLLPGRTLARFESLNLVEARLKQSSCGIAGEAAQGDFHRFTTQVLPRFRQRVSSDPQAAYDLGRVDPNAFYQSACSLIHWTEGDELIRRFNDVPCRKTMMYGGLNRHLEELGIIDDVSKHEVPYAAHFAMHDQPDAFYRSLTTLLSRVD
jgi:pimeloyl-ACP methyl ester carboxylesterase